MKDKNTFCALCNKCSYHCNCDYPITIAQEESCFDADCVICLDEDKALKVIG